MRSLLPILSIACAPAATPDLVLYAAPEAVTVTVASPTATVRVTNLGDLTFDLESVAVEGAGAARIAAVVDGVLPLRLAPGEVVSLEVSLDLDAVDEGPLASATVVLTGATTEPAPGCGGGRVTLSDDAQLRVAVGQVACDADGDGVERIECGGEDCDDYRDDVHPGGVETCDGADEDCDGAIDEDATDAFPTAPDSDGDGYGSVDVSLGCGVPDGWVACGVCGDCDDGDDAVHPDAAEVCGGGDEDCDGQVDEAGAVGEVLVYVDEDRDGFGDEPTLSCTPGEGTSAEGGDCDDTNPTVFPGAREVCDGADQDCTGEVDEGDVCPCPVLLRGAEPYLFCEDPDSWERASDRCAEVGYALVTIDDEDENVWVASQLYVLGGTWWGGGSDLVREGEWAWEDGTPWAFESWAVGQPGGGDQDCLELGRYDGGFWNDWSCAALQPFVCALDP